MDVIEKDIVKIFNNQLKENPEILKDIIAEFIEDVGLKKAIDEGLTSGNSTFKEAYSILEV